MFGRNMKPLKIAARLAYKLVHGVNISFVRISEEQWDLQYFKGKWEYLIEGTENVGQIVWYLLLLYSDAKKPIQILDVGCGNGALPHFLRKTQLPFKYVGTDLSHTALSHARRNYPQGTYIQADMETKPDVPELFDVIVLNEVLYYGDYKKIILAHRDLLSREGYFIISMYRTARTRWIWSRIRSLFVFEHGCTIYSLVRTVGWDVQVCRVNR